MDNERIARLMQSVPAATGFPGPDEVDEALAALVEQHPRDTRRTRIGTSRLGDPIHLVSIGDGDRSALVYAGPHSNEPVGFLTITHMAELLLGNHQLRTELGYTWHLIGCIDPDAARLNQGWYSGPFTRRNYARHFYRPAFSEQAEWTFPVTDPTRPIYFDRTLPETEALIRAIDFVRPDLMCSLHNAEFGGTYFYLSRDHPGLSEALADVVIQTGLPLHAGDAELPNTPRLGTGVFKFPTLEQIHGNLTDASPEPAAAGAGSHHYAERHQTLSVVVEVPLWIDPRSADTSASEHHLRGLVQTTATQLAETDKMVGDVLDAALEDLKVPASPFVSALADVRHITRAMATSYTDHARSITDKTAATIAEQFDHTNTVHLFRLRCAGTALRLLEAELAVGHHAPRIRAAHASITKLFSSWADIAEAETPGIPAAPASLAAVQLGSILTAASALSSSNNT
ncbi:M14 family zinc carboxypeptidase [Actinopolymorpha sp. B9G3]|uniref:M14 family zinc carboxypeptidase n=1 Tax=Actinopolymorpha sp. B9G3 TaxID=3158970 RepID=UPI0032D8F5D1